MNLCTENDEFDIYLSSTVNDYILYKWQTFGKKFHIVGGTAHFIYVCVLIMYNSSVYVNNVAKYRMDLNHFTPE